MFVKIQFNSVIVACYIILFHDVNLTISLINFVHIITAVCQLGERDMLDICMYPPPPPQLDIV